MINDYEPTLVEHIKWICVVLKIESENTTKEQTLFERSGYDDGILTGDGD